MSHSRSFSLQYRRRPQTPSLLLLFDTVSTKSINSSPISGHPIDFTISPQSTTRRSCRYSLQPRPSISSVSAEIVLEDQPIAPSENMPFGASQQFPPTPAHSIHTASQRNSTHFGEGVETMFVNAEAGPSSSLTQSLPPTPPISEDIERSYEPQNPSLAFDEPTITQRPRRGRRPASVYPTTDESIYQSQRKYTDPTPQTRNYQIENSPGLDVDLDAYSTTDFDGDERDPTLSIVTTSTADSTTGTPASVGATFDYKSEFGRKFEGEPRIRMRTTTGRANAYSSAESSLASGAYSYHAYADNNVYHPHPPPLPTVPIAFSQANDQVGLGISAHDLVIPARRRDSQAASSPSTGAPVSPSNSFAHRPWKRDVINRLRSDSTASSITTASMSTSESRASATAVSVSSQPYPFAGYAQNLPWEREDMESVTPEAVALVEEGNERIFNVEALEEMGGLASLTLETIEFLKGTTHLLLPEVGSEILTILSPLLALLAPTLVVLDLSSNYLSFLPETLQHCTSLEELNLAENPIRALPSWIGELTGLRMIVLDGCALQSLPIELSALSTLHTVCARRNRLVSLPGWLCLLGQLETLRIDDNPFASEWQSIVAPIVASSHAPPDVPRSTSLGGLVRSEASVASFSSTRSSSSRDIAAPESAAAIQSEGWVSPTSSAAQSLYQLSGLGPIAEDHPHSAPLEQSQLMTQPLAPPDEIVHPMRRGLRKMRSAGTLLNISNESTPIAPMPTGLKDGKESPEVFVPPSSSRFASFSGGSGRRAASVVGQLGSDSELSPPPRNDPLSTTTSIKSGKWGFLRKMSKHKLRGDKPEKPVKSLAASASANIKTLPPLVHANSDFVPGHPVRPSLSMTRSAMTLPTRKMTDLSEFGTGTLPSQTFGGPLNNIPSAGSMPMAQKRGKRMSFLPVDGPPSLNIAIPSTSPFMPPVQIFEDEKGLPLASSDASSKNSISASVLGHADPSADSNAEIRYTRGLESIKAYLRDLYDLSRPAIEPYGGFEVLASADGSCGASSAPSDNLSSPASNLRGSVSEARRARRPTLEAASRHPSSTSVVEDGASSFAGASEVSEGKKFKNDKAKRARVIREIYETERTYVRGLGELVTIYVRPAAQPANASKGESVVPASERKVVFGGIESIMSIHRDNLLPALEKVVRPLLDGVDDEEGELSTRTAHAVGEVFRTYIAYMKQYSTYINNFDNALSRMKTWTAPSSAPSTPGFASKSPVAAPSISSAAVSVGVGLGAISLPNGDPVPHSGTQMTASQRKRVKTFLKRCREHPMHSQINLESYLLLPIQRVPRYKLLLEDLAMCTMPRSDGPRDTLDDALNEIASLASLMNEEKRDADSRLRLLHWQQRISSRGPSPLVQPHRKLIMDGALTLIRLVKKASSFVEVEGTQVSDTEQTITASKAVVPVEFIAPEPMNRPIMLILCSDLLVLVQQRPGQDSWEGQVDLFNVLRMATLREPASIVHGNVLRVVDNKSIYYFNGASQSNTVQWCRAINSARRR